MKRAHLRKGSSLIWSSIFVIVLTFTCLGFLENPVLAQTRETTTDGSTPLGIAPGTPSGSYPLSDLDTVNLYNGGLNFSLPLLKIAGRGGAGYTMMVKIEPKFAVQKEQEFGQPSRYYADESWWIGEPMFSMGRLDVRHGIKNQYHVVCGQVAPTETLTRLTFTAPDGTEYEMRDQRTGGQPDHPTCAGLNRGTVFTTTDGSSATFISDNDVVDDAWDGSSETYASGYLMLRDGTRFRIDNSLISWMRDRNGNKLTFTYDGSRRLTAVTDSLNHIVTITYGGTYGYDQIAFKGFAGADRIVKLYRVALRDALRSGFSELTPTQLFPELDGGGAGPSKPIISAIELPNGQKYQFKYNPYGELARVELPTGGAFEYDWAAGTTDGAASGVISITGNKQIYRRIIERRIYPDGGTGSSFASRMTYSRPESSTSNAGYVIADQYNSDGTLLTRSYHYFYGSARSSLFQLPTQYPGWKDGKEYQTVNYATAGTAATQTNTTFAQRAAISWFSGNPDQEPPNDVRVVETTTTLLDTNQVSKRTSVNPNNSNDSGFDQYNNQTDVWEYGYGTTAPGGLVRHTHTDYVTAESYTDVFTGAHIRNLPKQTSVYDQNGNERARTVFEYDNYGAAENYHALIQTYPRAGFNELPISGLDPAFNSQTNNLTRGNVTATTRYLLNASGAVTGSITSYAQYDIAGNLVKAIDPRSTPNNVIATVFDYSDRFGWSDGEAESNTVPAELSSAGKFTYAFATKVTNAVNQSSFTQMDYYAGRAVDGEDVNTITQSVVSQNDPLDRPTKGIGAANQNPSKVQATTVYDDTNRTVTSRGDLNTFDDSVLQAKTIYDGLGRTIETRTYESETNYIAVRTEYDALGRAYKVSNPFRPWQNESLVWTTTEFDALGRIKKVTTPDGAFVTTSYSGNTATATDQAGKKRRSVSDALDRLVRVDEPDKDSGALDVNGVPVQSTVYEYDALDNLRRVTQGSQTRTFEYDSLKRLISATNPESGTVCYGHVINGECQQDGYDANGNLIYKTDARLILTTYAYDSLNRNTSVIYSDGTPAVHRYYDGVRDGVDFNIPNSKGRLWQTETTNTALTTIDEYDALGRIKSSRQQFYSNNSWSSPFVIRATYDKAGHVLTLTYPSNHSVSYSYDAAGRLADKDAQHLAFTGNLGDGTTRVYSSGISYSSFGGRQEEKFGTDTPLYHKQRYNVRRQLWDMRLSTVPFANDPTDGNRGAIVNYYSNNFAQGDSGADNNGNLLRQEIYVPGSSFFQDNFSYDFLNRLTSIGEKLNGAGNDTFNQAYNYDRYGNRSIIGAGGGANNMQPWTDPADNRLYAPGDQNISDREQRLIRYDAAGNQKADYYSPGSPGTRAYDAENRMVSAASANALPATYTYDGDGKRIKRIVNGMETWQVYGFGDELIAEYAVNGSQANLQKEYGYRNGELLVTADASSAGARTNVALATNGATATAQNYTQDGYYPGQNLHFQPYYANDGVRYMGPAGDHYWRDEHGLPSWLQIEFSDLKTIDEVDIYTVRDDYGTQEGPSATQTFANYGVTAFDVQYWNGSGWVTATGGAVSANNLVWRKLNFTAVSTTKIRVIPNQTVDGVARIAEVEAWGTAALTAPVNVAAASRGATATAQNYTEDGYYSGADLHFQPSYAIDGVKYIAPSGDHYWRDHHGLPSEIEIDFHRQQNHRRD
jgi:YD repeat-containing protein